MSKVETKEDVIKQVVPEIDTGTNRIFTVTLPSRGLLYSGKLPDGQIQLKPLTASEEAVLYNPATSGVDKIDNIIRSCVLSKIDVDDLLITDRFYILLMLRTNAFGSHYEFPVKCQHCSSQFKYNMNLAEDLTVQEMSDGAVEPFSVTLPKSGDNVQLRLIRGSDEKKIARYAKRMRMRTSDPSDPSFLQRMTTQLISVNNQEIEALDKERYIQNLEMADSIAIQKATEKFEAGIDMTVYVECASCGLTNEMTLPFSIEFFRPDSR